VSPAPDKHRCEQTESVSLYAVKALPAREMRTLEAHISECQDCHRELESLRPIIDSFFSWPTDVLTPSASLRTRLAHRIGAETGEQPVLPVRQPWSEPDWEEVAPGISCKLLATDTAKDRVSMLVRLAPGTEYPPHTHAGIEELHLLDGELWIEDRKLYPGDYSRAEPGTADKRVWSDTGCTCVLITSTEDAIR
jgi:quercetin dioxygenase-like cupin family protein